MIFKNNTGTEVLRVREGLLFYPQKTDFTVNGRKTVKEKQGVRGWFCTIGRLEGFLVIEDSYFLRAVVDFAKCLL